MFPSNCALPPPGGRPKMRADPPTQVSEGDFEIVTETFTEAFKSTGFGPTEVEDATGALSPVSEVTNIANSEKQTFWRYFWSLIEVKCVGFFGQPNRPLVTTCSSGSFTLAHCLRNVSEVKVENRRQDPQSSSDGTNWR